MIHCFPTFFFLYFKHYFCSAILGYTLYEQLNTYWQMCYVQQFPKDKAAGFMEYIPVSVNTIHLNDKKTGLFIVSL